MSKLLVILVMKLLIVNLNNLNQIFNVDLFFRLTFFCFFFSIFLFLCCTFEVLLSKFVHVLFDINNHVHITCCKPGPCVCNSSASCAECSFTGARCRLHCQILLCQIVINCDLAHPEVTDDKT